MNPNNSDHFENQRPSQQQSLGNVQVQGDDNTFNVIQAEVVTLTQTKIIQISVNEIKTRELITTSPYKGLKKFEPEDADHFFGRVQFLAGLVNELEQTHIVLLLGASGSGKSSVVRAGLIPWLQQKWGKHFVSLMFNPDHDPFESFYASLLSRGFNQAQAKLVRDGEAETLKQMVEQLKLPKDFWLIFIDQFEELFTVSEADKRDRFIDSLIQLSQASTASVKIVATMRADFLDRLSPYPRLVEVTDRHRPLMAEMQADELRLAIEQPAAHHGVVFETGLVEEIIKDVQGQAGCLPLLQYTLDLLWETEVEDGGIEDRTLNINSYQRLGGVRGALQQRVDQIYQALLKPEQLAAQHIFLKLVEIGGDEASGTEWRPVRRRANRNEFKAEQEQAVLTQLINQNLLVSNAVVQAAGTAPEFTVEISHEILLTSWSTLNDWIKQNRQAIALRNRLNEDVRQWQKTKGDDELWSGLKLARVVELKNDPTFDQVLGGFSPESTEFIEASVGLRDRLECEKEVQRQRELEQERKARKVAQRITVGATIGGALMTALALVAGFQARQAEIRQIQTSVALSAAKFANNQELEATIETIRAEKILQLSFWQAVLPNSQIEMLVLGQLQQMANTGQERNRLSGEGAVNSVVFSPDGKQLAVGRSGGTVRLWNISGKPLAQFKAEQGDFFRVVFSPDSKRLITFNNYDGTVRLWDTSGKQLAQFKEGAANDVAFSPDGKQLATGGSDGTVRLWDTSGKPLAQFKAEGAANDVAFSPDGKQLATGGNDGTVRLWNTSGKPLVQFKAEGAANDVAFSDGEIATEESDGTVRKIKVDNPVNNIVFSPNGKQLAAVKNNNIVIWDRSGKQLAQFKVDQGNDNELAFSPDSRQLTILEINGRIRMWDTSSKQLVELKADQEDFPSDIAFSPDGKQLAAGEYDGTVRLWDTSGKQLAQFKADQGAVTGVAFSPDGKLFAAGGSDGTVRLWDTSGKKLTQSKAFDDSRKFFHLDYKQLITLEEGGIALWDASGKQLAQFKMNQANFVAGTLSPDGRQFAATGGDSLISLWDTSGKQLELKVDQGNFTSVAFSPDSKQLAAGESDGTVRLWDTSGKQLAQFKANQGPVNDIAFSPDGEFATGGSDGTVRLWDTSGKQLAQFKAEGAINDIAFINVTFSLDGKQLAAVESNSTVHLWDISGKQLAKFRAAQGDVYGVLFSPDGKQLTILEGGSIIHLWTASGKQLGKLKVNQGNFFAVAFSPDGKQLTTLGDDGIVRLWQIGGINELLLRNCNWVKDYLENNPNVAESDRHLCDGIGTTSKTDQVSESSSDH